LDTLQSIRAFILVAELGSFKRAADSMSLSRANITRRVKDLESRLGTRLLNRTTRSQSLTEAGKIYLQRTRKIVDDIQHLEQSTITNNADLSGVLRIAASISLDAEVLANAVRTYIARYPKVRPHLSLFDDSVAPTEEEFDIGIALEATGDRVITHRLASCRLVACATPAYLKKHGAPIHPSQLAEHPCLSISASSGSVHDLVVFTSYAGEIQVRPASVLVTNNFSMMRQFVLRGMGIAFIPLYLVAGDLMQGDLTQILTCYRLPLFEIKARYPRHHAVNGKIRSFVDHLMSVFDHEWKETILEVQGRED
jgi:DNA-binding transcriptional LysR family regulator